MTQSVLYYKKNLSRECRGESKEELKNTGVSPETVRVFTGLEDCADLIVDLKQALA